MPTVDSAVETLVSAVYVSRAERAMTDQELSKLLERSRENNKKCGITGMLLYRNRDFMQLLEGPADSVDTLLRRLRDDSRHTGMIVLVRSPIQERHFSEWQMAFRDISTTDLTKMKGYSPFMDWSFNAKQFQEKPDLSYSLLLQFKDRLW